MRQSPSTIAGIFVLLTTLPGQIMLAQAAPAAPAAPAQAAASQDSVNELSVGVGKTILVDTAQPIARISVGSDAAIASAVSRTEVMVTGKVAGETNLIIWDIQGNRQFFDLSVRPSTTQIADTLEGLRREMRVELPQQTVRVSIDNGLVYLSGTVDDLTSGNRAVAIASTAGKVVNLLNVKMPPSDPQILLKVRFINVARSYEKQLGINLFDLGLGNVIGAVTTGEFSPPVVGGSGGSTSSSSSSTGGFSSAGGSALVSNNYNLLAFFPGLKSGADIQAAEQKGLIQILAEPNLVAANGKQASFLAGGQYPYPVVQSSAGSAPTVTIQFKDYGIRLNFIPTIMPNGTIRLQVAPEVSALDYTNSVTISGFTVPGITTQNVNTQVVLGKGQSFVIGGLLDNTVSETLEKVPFIGDIPILGKLFQSMQRTKNNNELIVIVTPEIVNPIPADQPTPMLNMPQPFMAPNSKIAMSTPENTPAGGPSTETIPMEKLMQSMKPETPLTGTEGTSGSGGAGMSGGGAASPAPSTGP